MTDVDGGRSPGSTIAASEMDDHRTAPSSPARADPRTSLQHVLGDTDSVRNTPPPKQENGNGYGTEDDDLKTIPSATKSGGRGTGKGRGKGGAAPKDTSNNASAFSGNKLKHLKKEDGEPLWRKDIQYEFLKAIFDDKTKVFTNSYEPETLGKQTFADLYIDAMARSSKTSKILRDKLLSDHEPAKNMAMVCLLVNLGRMNTTLNFFPEMRAQLRTYHAIPSLQAKQDPNSYKQLQDAPRLKSILKGASEDRPEPNTLDKIKETAIPRTNPVNLIFVLSQYAPKITELHFPIPRDFHDLVMMTTLSSKSRATAFLWLMWHYLESDFTEEGAAENPFGAGVDYGMNVANQGVPRFSILTKDQAELENVDTPEEIEYGEQKMRERKRIIEADQAAFQAEYGPPKRGPKPKLNLPPEDGTSPIIFRTRPSKYESDLDSTRSTPPPRGAATNMRIHSVLNGPGGRGRGKHAIDSSSPAPSGLSNTIIVNDASGQAPRRTRPLTAHQLAVEHNRNQRVNYILSRGLRKEHHHSRKERRTEGAILRAFHRSQEIVDAFSDSEGDEHLSKPLNGFRERGLGGLVQWGAEKDDFGEELAAYAAAFRRMGRRLERWDLDAGGAVKAPIKIQKEKKEGEDDGDGDGNGDETEEEKGLDGDGDGDGGTPRSSGRTGKRGGRGGRRKRPTGGDADGDVNMEDEDLDDMDKEILGLGSDAEEGDGEGDGEDEDLDDVEKTLLGLRGDETEEDVDVDGEGEGSDGGMDVD